MQVDLARFRSKDVRIFAGRPRGVETRKQARLDELDRTDEPVEVLVPDDVISVNSSFFLGMFEASIRSLKEAGFRRKYQFSGRDISDTVEFCISEALRGGSPLPDV